MLTQAAVVKSIIRCISPTLRSAELDRFLPRRNLLKGITPELCFRRMYAEERDSDITKVLYAFFKAVEKTYTYGTESLWSSVSTDNIINTTVGYETFLNLLKLILASGTIKNQFSIAEYEAFLSKAVDKIDFTDMVKYRKTSTTKSLLLNDLKIATDI